MSCVANGTTTNGSESKVEKQTNVGAQELFQALYDMQVFRLGEFFLKSGQMTPIYIDLRRCISHPKTLRLAAQCLCDIITSKNLKLDYVVGVPYAALPLATLVSDILDIPMLMQRKEAKTYGTKKLLEGVYTPGGRVLLIEDVVTLGDSIKETAESIRKEGMEVVDAVAVLDRQQGATGNLKKCDLVFHSAITMDAILSGMIEKGDMTEQRKTEIIAHLAKPY